MKKAFIILAVVVLSGCAQIKTWVPSFWDDNQSRSIVDVQQSIHQLDCDQPHLAQAARIRSNLEWFRLYSVSKGWRQGDVMRLTDPMWLTVDDFYSRSKVTQGSKAYCTIKRQLLIQQSDRAASAVLGRF